MSQNQVTYTEIKNKAYTLLKEYYPAIELIFRNEENTHTLLIFTRNIVEKTRIIDLLSNSGYFKTRRFKDQEWKFTLVIDKNIFKTFKTEKLNASNS